MHSPDLHHDDSFARKRRKWRWSAKMAVKLVLNVDHYWQKPNIGSVARNSPWFVSSRSVHVPEWNPVRLSREVNILELNSATFPFMLAECGTVLRVRIGMPSKANSIQQSPSSDAASILAGQELLRLLQNPKVHNGRRYKMKEKSLCLTKLHTMKANRGSGSMAPHIDLSGEVSGQIHADRFTPTESAPGTIQKNKLFLWLQWTFLTASS